MLFKLDSVDNDVSRFHALCRWRDEEVLESKLFRSRTVVDRRTLHFVFPGPVTCWYNRIFILLHDWAFDGRGTKPYGFAEPLSFYFVEVKFLRLYGIKTQPFFPSST